MSAAAPALPRSFDWKWIVIGLWRALTVYVAVGAARLPPVGRASSRRRPPPKRRGSPWRTTPQAYGSADRQALLEFRLQFAFGASLFSFSLGTALAMMNERTTRPSDPVFGLSIIPLVISGDPVHHRLDPAGQPPRSASSIWWLQDWFGLDNAAFTSIRLWG